MKKIAIIGLGKMGLLHASLLNTMHEVELVAFCEKNGLVSRFARNIVAGITLVNSIDKLSEFNLDAVYVTTPPSSHHAIISQVLAQGICRNVFVEKPLANNAIESEYLEGLPARLGIDSINMVGYNRRFSVTLKKAREIIEGGSLGEPVSFEAYALSSDFQPEDDGSRHARGSVIKDLASHAIDLVIWYVGSVVVESIVSSRLSNSGTIDSAVLKVVTNKGLQGQIKASWVESDYRLPEIGFIIKGNKGLTLVANEDVLELRSDSGERRVWYRHDLDDTANFLIGSADYWREDKAFINAIGSREAVEPNFSTALRVDEIIHDAEMRISGRL
jgi:predicted dehydrogenase